MLIERRFVEECNCIAMDFTLSLINQNQNIIDTLFEDSSLRKSTAKRITRMNTIEKILEKKQVRITAVRQLLLEFFVEKNKILGLVELEKAFPRADRITIYRTLKTFEEKGIIHSISNGTAEVKYALCNEFCTPTQHVDNHPHFQCVKCNRLECLESVLVPQIELPKGYSIENVEMTIRGICANC